MIAIPDIKLHIVAARAHHGASRIDAAVGTRVADGAGSEQQVIAGPVIGRHRGVKRRVDALAALIGQRVGIVRRRGNLDTGVGHGVASEIAIQIALDLGAQRPIQPPGLGQRQHYLVDRHRTCQYRLASQDQHAFDLALDFGRQVERQIGAGAAGAGNAAGADSRGQHQRRGTRAPPAGRPHARVPAGCSGHAARDEAAWVRSQSHRCGLTAVIMARKSIVDETRQQRIDGRHAVRIQSIIPIARCSAPASKAVSRATPARYRLRIRADRAQHAWPRCHRWSRRPRGCAPVARRLR